MFDYIKQLISRDNPARSHVALTGLTVIILCFLALFVGIAGIWIAKSLVAELTAILTALVSLVGFNVVRSKVVNKTEDIKDVAEDEK